MYPTLTIVGVSVQTYPFALILAAVAGLWLAERTAHRLGVDGEAVNSLGFYGLSATALGARLAYVIGNWRVYRGALLSIFSITPTALWWPGGVAVGCFVSLVYWRHRRLPVGATLDAIAPGLALALAVERLGAFLSGRGFGRATTLPWGVTLLDEVRHPVQLYEAAALLLILSILLLRHGRRPFAGHTGMLFVALYAGSRLVLEAFRAQTPLLAGGVRTIQVAALAVTTGALGYLYHRRFAPARDVADEEAAEG